MDKVPLTETAIQKAAEARREEAVNRLNTGVAPPSNEVNFTPHKSPMLQRQSKRNEALLTSAVLTAVVGLSTLVHPLDWRLATGCLCAGIVMALGMLLEKKGHPGLMAVVLLASTALGLLTMVLWGGKGPMIWVQSMPLIGIGCFGFAYMFFDHFDINE